MQYTVAEGLFEEKIKENEYVGIKKPDIQKYF